MQRHFVISKHELEYCSYTLIHDLRCIGGSAIRLYLPS